MRIDDPELIDRLAAAYVLGTLRGAARRRLERKALDTEGQPLRAAIWRWERRLNAMVSEVTPVQPPARVWRRITRALDESPGKGHGLWLWRALSAGLAVLALVLVLPYFQAAPTPQPAVIAPAIEQLALIQGENEQPLWVITLDLEAGALRSRAISTPARELDRVFELWLLPGQGQPRSVGLLPLSAGDRGENQLSPALLSLLRDAQGLAVSVEPPGGSPTGLPTGPVVYTAPLVEL